ncbi:MAG: substrate-binding domain-containing protein [Minwuia sp.]|nr:substrate-binding domain-containing protein [Minwuia sp.]
MRARKPTLVLALLLLILTALAGQTATAADRFIILQSTTSTENSGLYGYLLPLFRAKSGIEVRVVAVGTGQALRNARNGDGDVLIVHARAAEDAFVADGHGVTRHDLMANDFVIVGPADDPAGISGLTDTNSALRRLAGSAAPFVSRGDDSGTHKKERALWMAAGIAPAPDASWYREAGSGMGATLNIAIGMDAYTLVDRATWLSFGNRQDHRLLVEGDPALQNPYGVILVNPARHPGIRAVDGQTFIDWLLSPTGQAAIAAFRVNGKQLFFPARSQARAGE